MSDKPDSVTFENSKASYHLSELPTPPPDPPNGGYTFRVKRFKRIVDIHGISIRKVYPNNKLLYYPVCSYHTFSPLPRQAWR